MAVLVGKMLYIRNKITIRMDEGALQVDKESNQEDNSPTPKNFDAVVEVNEGRDQDEKTVNGNRRRR